MVYKNNRAGVNRQSAADIVSVRLLVNGRTVQRLAL